MNKNVYIAIMAGGIGSRFWPESTADRPKQFLDILGSGKSLLRSTFERFSKWVPQENILIVTHKSYKDLCLQQVPEIPAAHILCEPSRNNTAPSVAYTALRIHAMNPEAIFVMAPSDHVILKEDEFVLKLNQGLQFLENKEAILTLGIQPSRPDTGYGYIEMAENSTEKVRKVLQFKEKPTLEVAQKYLQKGNYLWNAGIFMWKTSTILESFKTNAPEIYQILTKDISVFNTPVEQEYIDQIYPLTPNISVDYAILEKADNVFTIPVDIGWSDLGTWKSLHDYVKKDSFHNFITSDKVYTEEVHNSIIKISKNKKAIISGLDDYIIVENEEALLIYPKSREQDIKDIVKKIM